MVSHQSHIQEITSTSIIVIVIVVWWSVMQSCNQTRKCSNMLSTCWKNNNNKKIKNRGVSDVEA